MRRLSAAQERILGKCEDITSRVFKRARLPRYGAPEAYSWELGTERKCTRQTDALARHGYIEPGELDPRSNSRPWLLTDLGRAYKERYLS